MSDLAGSMAKLPIIQHLIAKYGPVATWGTGQTTSTTLTMSPTEPRCTICRDQGWVVKGEPNPNADVPIYRARPCRACEQPESPNERAERLRPLSGIAPEDLDANTFARFDVTANPACADALKAARTWAKGLATPFLVLSGTRGLGKTHLGLAAAGEAMDRGEAVFFLSVPAFLDELRSAAATGGSDRRLLRHAIDYPAVILDDLGMERVTDFADEQLYLLVNERYRHRRRTLITTMRAPGELHDAIASRIQDWQRSRVVRCVGTDYRTRRQIA